MCIVTNGVQKGTPKVERLVKGKLLDLLDTGAGDLTQVLESSK